MTGTKTTTTAARSSDRAAYYDSPIGRVEIVSDGEAITRIAFADDRAEQDIPGAAGDPLLALAVRELDAYFREGSRTFSMPLRVEGTAFQRTVLSQVRAVPFGETASYRDIAVRSGSAGAVRAVGSANARNRLMIVIPCHRIVGSNGAPTGYAGGLWRKEWLLRHERSHR